MKYIRIPKLEKWQHYKNRSPVWIKLHRDILMDYKFATLPDGAKAHLMQLWLVASQCENVIPHDAKWIAKKINATQPVDLNLFESLGFIEVVQNASTDGDDAYQNASLEKEKEKEKEEERKQRLALLAERFDVFWTAYPRKINKKKARQAWMSNELGNGIFDTIMQALDRAKRSEQWNKDDGKWIPHPTTWLNGERWEDDITASEPDKLKLDWGDE